MICRDWSNLKVTMPDQSANDKSTNGAFGEYALQNAPKSLSLSYVTSFLGQFDKRFNLRPEISGLDFSESH